jgi:hypothetical protein
MPCRLLVILGAGASFDCATGSGGQLHADLRPPLVTQLFETRPAFTRILRHYPLAQKAAADIRPAIADSSVAIEEFLRETLRDSEFDHRRDQYWAIPLYLQHLLFEVSRWAYRPQSGYAEQPDCYDRLINAALQVDEVTFVSLNYDDIFDQRLFVHDALDSLSHYLSPNRNWALIKLHGSINWGRRVLNVPTRVLGREATDSVFSQTFAHLGLDIKLSDEIELRPQSTVRETRLTHGSDLYFPALSAPLGAEDDLVCPPEHVTYLKKITGHHDPLDLLVIGYSGLDVSVLKLVSWGGRTIRSLGVVSDSKEHAVETSGRIMSIVNIEWPDGAEPLRQWTDGFTSFTQGTDLAEYVALIRKIAAQEDKRSEQLRAIVRPSE